MNIKNLLKTYSEKLKNISDTAKLDCELLLGNILNKPRSFLFSHSENELTNFEIKNFNKVLARRLKGEPIAYILGSKEFWSLNFKVNKNVLIPRPETELLVEIILKNFSKNNNIRLADLGTGSGAIALALAKEKPSWNIVATDISENALAVAKENAENLKINNVSFICSDWCSKLTGSFDIIVSNPPYVSMKDLNNKFEPKAALISNNNGLEDIEKIINQSKNFLLDYGFIIFEHGFNQAEQICEFLNEEGFKEIKSYTDLAGHKRVTSAVFNSKI